MAKEQNMLPTGFCGTSAQALLTPAAGWQTLFLPNDKTADSRRLTAALAENPFDLVVCFKPLIKDRLCIETTARDGALWLDTAWDCEKLCRLFARNGLAARISHNAGTSFCNRLYYSRLQYIAQHSLQTRLVFIHIPFKKNSAGFADFRQRVFRVLACCRSGNECANKMKAVRQKQYHGRSTGALPGPHRHAEKTPPWLLPIFRMRGPQ